MSVRRPRVDDMFDQIPPSYGGGSSPDSVAAMLASATPAPLPIAQTLMLAEDPSALSPNARVDLLIALEKAKAAIDAAQQLVLAAAESGPADGRDWVEIEISTAMHWSAYRTKHRLSVARQLVDRLPRALDALRRGHISYQHASLFAELVEPLTDAQAAAVQERIFATEHGETVADFRRRVRRAVIRVDPDDADERHKRANQRRTVGMEPLDDGMANVWATLPADAAVGAMTVLDALAGTKQAGDERSIDQRRADSFAGIFRSILDGGELPTQRGRRPHLQLVVPIGTELGIDGTPAELPGYGPIPDAIARRIAADATWTRLLTDPATGELLDYGRTTYEPPQNLKNFVDVRDRVCVMPGCNVPAG